MSFIELENLKKEYKMGTEVVYALDGVSLNIKEGEIIAVVGPSGSGKSTLMQIIGGLDKPTSGKVVVDNQDINKFSQRRLAQFRNKKIGFVFQTFNLQPDYTALENVELPLIFAGIRPKSRKAKSREAIVKVGLEDRINHRPSELSGGQRQRVSIARAIVNSPKIILADEPTGNLDSKNGKRILELLKKLNKEEGVTIIIVTHDANVAAQADRIINMQDGKIIN